MKTIEHTHTPGPWHYANGDVHDEDGDLIAVVWGVYPSRDGTEVKANARLMAAAPELLNAVNVALAFFFNPTSFNPVEVERIYEAAIRKAADTSLS